MAADWREESPANTCLKVFGQTLPLGSLLQLPLLKGEHSMTAVGYEVYEELKEKHPGIQHSVFLASYMYDGTNTESCLLIGNPHKSTSDVPDR